jgi:integrase
MTTDWSERYHSPLTLHEATRASDQSPVSSHQSLLQDGDGPRLQRLGLKPAIVHGNLPLSIFDGDGWSKRTVHLMHLLRRNGTWYFRYVLPATTAERLQASEIRFTLNTSNKPYAKQLAAQCFARCCTLAAQGFTCLAQAVEYVKAIPIIMDELTPLTALMRRFDTESLQQAFRIINANNLPAYVKVNLTESTYFATKRTKANIWIPIRLDNHPSEIIVPYFDTKAEIQAGFLSDNITINFVAPYTVHLHQLHVRNLPEAIITQLRNIKYAVTSASTSSESPKISEEFEKFKKLKEPSWGSPKTVDEYTSVITLLIEIISDKPVLTVTNDDYDKFILTIRKLPPNRKTNPKLIGKSLEEIIAMGSEPISDRTVEKYHNRVVTFIDWLKKRHRDLHIHPTLPKAKEKLSTKRSRMRKPFTDEQLSAIFESEASLSYLGKQKQPHKVWLPILGLFLGVRINEAAQLKLCDVKDDTPIPYISINDEGEDKGVKTAAGLRDVPIHPKLIELGFLDYVRYLRTLPERKTDGRLFGDLQYVEGRGYGHQASQWFGNFLDKLGITEKPYVFHSFRHLVSGILNRTPTLKDWVISKFLGHDADDDATESVTDYMNEIRLEDLASCTQAINYPKLNLSGYAELCRKTYK